MKNNETAFDTFLRLIGEEKTLLICETLNAEKVRLSKKNIAKIRAVAGVEAAALIWFRFQGEQLNLPTAAGVKKIREERARAIRLERYRKSALKDATAAFLEGIARESVVRARGKTTRGNAHE